MPDINNNNSFRLSIDDRKLHSHTKPISNPSIAIHKLLANIRKKQFQHNFQNSINDNCKYDKN